MVCLCFVGVYPKEQTCCNENQISSETESTPLYFQRRIHWNRASSVLCIVKSCLLRLRRFCSSYMYMRRGSCHYHALSTSQSSACIGMYLITNPLLRCGFDSELCFSPLTVLTSLVLLQMIQLGLQHLLLYPLLEEDIGVF